MKASGLLIKDNSLPVSDLKRAPVLSTSTTPFIGFTSAGLPAGITFSFLISSPLVDLASVILLASIFSWQIAIAYVTVGVVIAVIGDPVISRVGMERHIAADTRGC